MHTLNCLANEILQLRVSGMLSKVTKSNDDMKESKMIKYVTKYLRRWKKRQLTWVRHVKRMAEDRWPRKVLTLTKQ